MQRKITAVGDCNTLGAKKLERKSYPERVGQIIGAEVINLGHTMATTREGVRLLQDFLKDDVEYVFIQFGLVDSYRTFKYSPYVLYYPDNFLRKPLRSATKKFKKICRRTGLNTLFGEVNVVKIDEYEKNIRRMIEIASPRPTFLIDTVPNHQRDRNGEIQRYNKVLDGICQEYDRCVKVDLYEVFEENLKVFYLDSTHCNQNGYEYIAKIISRKLKEM